jgi:rRNA-processing protein FCF1
VRVVFEPSGETADEWLIREAFRFTPYWLVTSDRELRELAGDGAERVIGGGSFARELLKRR